MSGEGDGNRVVTDGSFVFLKNCSTEFRNNLMPEIWAKEQDSGQH